METDHESIAAQGWLVGPRPCSQQPELNAEARANSLDMHKKLGRRESASICKFNIPHQVLNLFTLQI